MSNVINKKNKFQKIYAVDALWKIRWKEPLFFIFKLPLFPINSFLLLVWLFFLEVCIHSYKDFDIILLLMFEAF